jgi:hypothetical protein
VTNIPQEKDVFGLYFIMNVSIISEITVIMWGHAVAWLRHYATRQKFAGSIPDEVIGFFL